MFIYSASLSLEVVRESTIRRPTTAESGDNWADVVWSDPSIRERIEVIVGMKEKGRMLHVRRHE